VVTDVCVAFLTLSLIEAGYDVFVVTDASGMFFSCFSCFLFIYLFIHNLPRAGTFTPEIARTAHLRMATAGAQLLNLFAVACELARDWRTDLEGLAAYFSEYIPLYKTLITSWSAFTNAKK
jgi:hypothetical protein